MLAPLLVIATAGMPACSAGERTHGRFPLGRARASAPRSSSDRATTRVESLSLYPPIVERAELRLLSPHEETAELTVRYGEDPRLGATVPLTLERNVVVLRDDGRSPDQIADDRIYTAHVTLDLQEVLDRRARLARRRAALGRELEYVTSHGRAITGRVPIESFAVDELLRGATVAIPRRSVSAREIERSHSLFITDLGVVRDPRRTSDGCPENDSSAAEPSGVWTFGYLMRRLGESDPSTFAQNWLATWASDQSVNDFTVAARPNVSIIRDRWQQLSGGPDQPLDLTKAPFRLLAIVLRIDRARNVLYGSTDAGGLEFIFGGVGAHCVPTGVTVSFEYGVRVSSCGAMRAWAQRWVDLSAFSLGSDDYNALLESLTQQVVAPTASSPVVGQLNQIRTNEGVFVDPRQAPPRAWELREFRIDPSDPEVLRQVAVQQTPDASLNRTQVIAKYIDAHTATILANDDAVPRRYPGRSAFLAGSALMLPAGPSAVGTYWDGPTAGSIANAEARFQFSLDTCNGCHAGETRTGGFHVDPRGRLDSAARLSTFLTGASRPVADPSGIRVGGVVPAHAFADLDLRSQDLARFANQQCLFLLMRDLQLVPPIFTH